MTPDILVKKKNKSELEDINGYFVKKGEQYGLDIPYNDNIYSLCKNLFKDPDGFEPLSVKELYNEINT